MTRFLPFASPAQSTALGGLTITSDDQSVVFAGDLEINRDVASLERAERMIEILDAIVENLKAGPLADGSQSASLDPQVKLPNPFES
jgi:hypothetical protein